MEGAGVNLKRAFGYHQMPVLDPFLLLDAFKSDKPDDYVAGFPWHPHRGIETITYILEGDVEHQDSLGNGGIISSGDVQWMTAGGGILHQEMPKGDKKGRMYGFQLWANLPASNKMMDPRYREVKGSSIPIIKTAQGALVRVVSGEVDGTKGPVQDVVASPEFLDVYLPAHSEFTRAIPAERTAFAYVMEGEGRFEPMEESAMYSEGTLILFGRGDFVSIQTKTHPVRFLLVSGKPLGETIAWHGPIVMNTKEEIKTAFEELEAGKFVRHAK